jgi:Tfp pilus assembly protein PilF
VSATLSTRLALGFVLAIGIAAPSPARADRAIARAMLADGDEAMARGDRNGARHLFEEALAQDPDYVEAYRRVVPIWLAAGELAPAIHALERMTLRYPDDARAWYQLAYAYRRQQRWEAAAMAYEAYLALRPGEAAPYFGLGIARLRAGETAGARAALSRYLALERDPAQAGYREQARQMLDELALSERRAAIAPPGFANPSAAAEEAALGAGRRPRWPSCMLRRPAR